MNEKIARLRQMIDEAEYAVAFTGAGVSTDSGLTDFRGASGVYTKGTGYGVPAEEILSPGFYKSRTADFFDFYRTRLLDLSARSNYIHFAMADMEKKGKLRCVITQNADNLHHEAGSKNVIDFHGNVHVNHCESCGKSFPATAVADCEGIPYCDCGGVIRPGILLFEEIPDMKKVMALTKELSRADLLIVAGSSLKVSSAHRLIKNYKGRLVILNLDPTPYDHKAELIINAPLGDIFRKLWPMD